ncbi:MAG: carbamate kinase [Spirochaetes bacterium]|nr:carbamate kinase [Spirochaetota bacterium]
MRGKRTAVVAIGGNSLIKDEKNPTVEHQYESARETCMHIADMIEQGWEVTITHGNGPQVGFILRRSEIAAKVAGMHEVPLDVCGADSQGALGYALQQNLQNILYQRGIRKNVATIITQTLVDKDDPAFRNPTKPIGSFMTKEEAQKRIEENGWSVIEDANRGYRRVVPSPIPKEIVELETIQTLISHGIVTITTGGGGIPVIDPGDGNYRGVAAVIDKDYASSLLARTLQVDLFVISTAVEKVALFYGTPKQKWIDRLSCAEAKGLLTEGIHFAKGSMAPKIQSIIWYLEAVPHGKALITNPENLGRALKGETGTWFVP